MPEYINKEIKVKLFFQICIFIILRNLSKMNEERFIDGLSAVGKKLQQLIESVFSNQEIQQEFDRIMKNTALQNPWFTKENILHVLANVVEDLKPEYIKSLLIHIGFNDKSPKRVAVILAGNKPLYGFPEMLCIFLSGHIFIGKQTSNDNKMLELIGSFIQSEIPEFSRRIVFTTSKLESFDAIIANDLKMNPDYFVKYFSKYPHLLHKRKYSMALLTGEESDETIKNLGKDIFTYFERTIYNVTRLLIPEHYAIGGFLDNLESYQSVFNFHRYADQYEYNKSVFLINKIPHYDNGFLLLRQHDEHNVPVGCLYFSVYQDVNEAKEYINNARENIESVISSYPIEDAIAPGRATHKSLNKRSRVPALLNFLNNL